MASSITKNQVDLILKQTSENASLLGNLNTQTLNLGEGIRDIKKQITHLEDKIDTVDKNSRLIDKDVAATNQNYIHLEKQFTSHVQDTKLFHEKLLKELDEKFDKKEKETLDKSASYTRSENLKLKNQSLIALITAMIGVVSWVVVLIVKLIIK